MPLAEAVEMEVRRQVAAGSSPCARFSVAEMQVRCNGVGGWLEGEWTDSKWTTTREAGRVSEGGEGIGKTSANRRLRQNER